jgi:16S rRNA processing protein RimM
VRGEVRVKAFTGDPLALGDYGPLFDAAGNSYTIVDLRPSKTVVIARIKEIATREAAEAANGTELFVPRAALPDDLEEDEFYQTDLIGLAAMDNAGARLGTVKALHDFGAGDILELRFAAGGTALIPFTKAAVPHVAVAQGLIEIDPVAAGLIGDDEEEEPRA